MLYNHSEIKNKYKSTYQIRKALENKEIYPKVVETSYGYHIIKKTGEKYVDFDDEKDSLMETLSNNKQNTLLQDALEKYNVKINI